KRCSCSHICRCSLTATSCLRMWSGIASWRRGRYPMPLLDRLKDRAKGERLWNLFLPGLREDEPGTRLSNLEYAPLAEMMGRLPWVLRGFQLQCARHRKHGAPASLCDKAAERALADATA